MHAIAKDKEVGHRHQLELEAEDKQKLQLQQSTMPNNNNANDADLLFRVAGGVLRAVKANMVLKLFCCLLIDTIGFATYLLPGIGELGDVAWAPIQAVLLLYLF